MDIRPYTPSQITNDYTENVKATQGGSEFSFLDFAAQAVKEGKIGMQAQVGSDKTGFSKTKFGFDKNPDLAEVKEEEIQKFLKKIQTIMGSKNT